MAGHIFCSGKHLTRRYLCRERNHVGAAWTSAIIIFGTGSQAKGYHLASGKAIRDLLSYCHVSYWKLDLMLFKMGSVLQAHHPTV